jgi:OMF family outer membrane factor
MVFPVRRNLKAWMAAIGLGLGSIGSASWAQAPLDPQPMPLPQAQRVKGSRPKSNPKVLPPAATKLDPALQRLAAPASLALPTTLEQVRIAVMRPLSLKDVENLAEVNNPNLKAIASQVDQAESNLRAKIASWYPTLSVAANGFPQYTGGQQFFNDVNISNALVGIQSTFTNRWQMTGAFTANWDVINPRRVPEVSAARDQFEKAKNQYLIALRELRLQAAQAYYKLQLADENVRVGQESVRASLVSLRDAKARYQAGVATKLEVLEAETQLGRDEQLLADSLAEQLISRRDLARLANLPQNVTPTASEPLRPMGLWKPSLQESILAAYTFREELDNIILDISASNSQANAALGQVQPFMSIVNTLTAFRYTGVESIIVDLPGTYGYAVQNSVSLNFRMNIFDGGAARALYRQNKQKAEENAFAFATTRDQLRFQVEQSFYQLANSQRNIQTTSREVLSSRESLRLARLRFQAGVTTQREVINNQRDLTQAEIRYASALSRYNTFLAELRRRTGLDQIVECRAPYLPALKPSSGDSAVPVPPTPLVPACMTGKLTAAPAPSAPTGQRAAS